MQHKELKYPKLLLYMFTFLVWISFLGCSTMPGGVSINKSSYDGATEIHMLPGWAGSDLKLGVWRTSKMDPNTAILVVRIDLIQNFSTKMPNLFIKIDGVETKFSSKNKTTECHVSSASDTGHCLQEYVVSMQLIENMVHAKEVKIKLHLSDSDYAEGNLDSSGPTTAKKGLIDFLAHTQGKK